MEFMSDLNVRDNATRMKWFSGKNVVNDEYLQPRFAARVLCNLNSVHVQQGDTGHGGQVNRNIAWLQDENMIRTIGDYSRHSHEGYQNTIEIPDGNNAVPLRSDTIRMEDEKSVRNNGVVSEEMVVPSKSGLAWTLEEVDGKGKVENRTNNEPATNTKEDLTGEKVRELVDMPRSQPVKFDLKHKTNKELI
nr:hypothetical protein [Tanacetum cinerariifolium]